VNSGSHHFLNCHAVQRRTVELTDTLTEKVNDLYNEKCQLEQFVSRFKYNNRNYLKIKSIAEQIVYGLLAEQGALLTSAIMAVVQALRVNPDKYSIIFDSPSSIFVKKKKIRYFSVVILQINFHETHFLFLFFVYCVVSILLTSSLLSDKQISGNKLVFNPLAYSRD
jgi:hypothetical protein